MGVGKERGDILTWVFMGMHMLMQCLCHAYVKECEKWWRDRLLYTTIFNRVFDILRTQIHH